MNLGDRRWPELDGPAPVTLLVPVGSVEQHGPHLPLDTDTRIATAVATACQFWEDNGLNALADADDIVRITHRINGGENGLADRKAALARIKAYLGP